MLLHAILNSSAVTKKYSNRLPLYLHENSPGGTSQKQLYRLINHFSLQKRLFCTLIITQSSNSNFLITVATLIWPKNTFNMEGFRWTRDLCEVLIYLWQQNDILYDVNHKDFKDKNKKDQAIFDILTELKKLDNTVTVKAIHKKIRTLCSQYANEFKRLKAVDGYEPQLWCFQQLSFLRNRPNPRTSISNIDTTDNSCNLQSISLSIEELNTSGETTPQVPKKKKSIIEAESKLLRLKKLLKNKKPKSYDWLAEQLVYKISRIEDETIRQETVQTIRIILKLNDKDTLENANTKPSVTKKKIKTEENDEDNPLKDVERKVLDFKEIFNTAVDSEYYCLGKRVAEEVCNIQDDYEREQICWTIQSVLQENLQKDKQCQHKNLDIQIST